MRPEKGTPEYELWLCAIDVAHAAPLKQGANVFMAQVPWDTIDKLRAAIEAVGIDWKGTHPSNRKAKT